jgi:serine protease Do
MRDGLTTISLPPDSGRDESLISGQNPMQGARVANITPALADEMQMDFAAKGVVVTAVERGSQADRFGLQAGDIVRQLNGDNINTVAQLRRGLVANDSWLFAIQRGDRVLQLDVQ